jgi:hypothetical protein
MKTADTQPTGRRHLHHLCVISFLLSGVVLADDQRQLAVLPLPAQETLRQEMLDNLMTLNEILTLVGAGKLKEAGDIAEQTLGLSAQGKHRNKPFDARPGPHMPPAMHAIGMDGHRSASEFAKAAQAGDRERAMSLLPNLTNSCVSCHMSWRAR